MRIKTLFTIVALTTLLAGSAYGAAIYNVDPTGTYLRVDASSTDSTDPLFIDLLGLGFTPGMSIQLQTRGDYTYVDGGGEVALPLGAIFVKERAINPNKTLLYRLNSVANLNGDPIGAGNFTWPTGDPTDIAWDFLVPTGSTTTVTIPTGATYLAVAVIDSWYDDNFDAENLNGEATPGDPGVLGISIDAAAVPEPGTLILLVPGLGLLWAIRRRQKSS